MSLLRAFVHDVVVHPARFVAALLARAGAPAPLEMVEAVHDAVRDDDQDVPATAVDSDERDETESWPVPTQAPHTPASRSLEYRPPAPTAPPEPPAPRAGSAADRLARARLR